MRNWWKEHSDLPSGETNWHKCFGAKGGWEAKGKAKRETRALALMWPPHDPVPLTFNNFINMNNEKQYFFVS